MKEEYKRKLIYRGNMKEINIWGKYKKINIWLEYARKLISGGNIQGNM